MTHCVKKAQGLCKEKDNQENSGSNSKDEINVGNHHS